VADIDAQLEVDLVGDASDVPGEIEVVCRHRSRYPSPSRHRAPRGGLRARPESRCRWSAAMPF
jgi:hypothetical protein